MVVLLLTVVGASLAGSLHCAGMCGPLVAFAVGTVEPNQRRWPLRHVLYHSGRLVGYVALGAAAGLLGASVNLTGSLVGVQRVAAYVAGGLMVAVGLIALARALGAKIGATTELPGLRRAVAFGQRLAFALPPTPRAGAIGLLTAGLPCGWLYAFLIPAAGTASAFWGAAVMAAFWVGTVPILLGVGLGVQGITRALGPRLPLITSLALVILGLVTIGGRLAIPAHAFDNLHAPPATTQSAIEQVQSLDAGEAPCCKHHGG